MVACDTRDPSICGERIKRELTTIVLRVAPLKNNCLHSNTLSRFMKENYGEWFIVGYTIEISMNHLF